MDPVPAFVRLAGHPLRWRLLTALADGDHRVRELVTLVGEPQNLVSYHLRLLRDGGLVTTNRSSYDGRDTYYHLDLDRCAAALAGTAAALHPALTGQVPDPPRVAVLFVCSGNSARSPIAEALLHHRTGGRVDVLSAGGVPKPELHAGAVRVLRQAYGIDVAGRRPRHWDTLTGRRFDYVISLCDRAREVVPDFPGRPQRVHWSVPDPAPGGDAAFRRTAADIDTRIRHLVPALTRHRTERSDQP
jgi:protein-tyrosine-phosphatase/DNA-binding transcriptional ArsR family regulator